MLRCGKTEWELVEFRSVSVGENETRKPKTDGSMVLIAVCHDYFPYTDFNIDIKDTKQIHLPRGQILDEGIAEEPGTLAALHESIQDRVGERNVQYDVGHVLVDPAEALLHLFRADDAGFVQRLEEGADRLLGLLVQRFQRHYDGLFPKK